MAKYRRIGDLSNLLELRLNRNQLNGSIPLNLGNLHQLMINLDLSQNSLSGPIPSSLGKLSYLIAMNLSHNNLTDQIPASFAELVSLSSLDLSYNDLQGPVPQFKESNNSLLTFYAGNLNLCGGAGLKPCNEGVPPSNQGSKNSDHKIIFIVVPIASALLVLAVIGLLLFAWWRRRRIINLSKGSSENDTDTFSLWPSISNDRNIIAEILQATENFNDRYCIGKGGFAAVYRALLPSGEILAVKKLYPTTDGIAADRKTFMSEIETLAGIRHRNIVKLHGYCCQTQLKLLVYAYMENGNLGQILHGEGAKNLQWRSRCEIVEGIAHALAYLHHDCSPAVVHRDISCNNVLLDSTFQACVSDFGTAKLLYNDISSWSKVAGSFGYMAPELAYTMKATEKCDVYSFGVVVLEVITGRHPVTGGEPGEEVNILQSITTEKNGAWKEMYVNNILDGRIEGPQAGMVDKIICLLKIAFECINHSPAERPSMREVAKNLQFSNQRSSHNTDVHNYYLNTITISDLLYET